MAGRVTSLAMGIKVRRPGMQSHAYPDWSQVVPCRGLQRPLPIDSRLEGRWGGREGCRKGVANDFKDDPAVGCDCLV